MILILTQHNDDILKYNFVNRTHSVFHLGRYKYTCYAWPNSVAGYHCFSKNKYIKI